jgi:hypothetical protein
LLRFFRIRPQIRVRRLLFYLDELLAQRAGVKDTPAGREPWSLEKCIAVPVHPTYFDYSVYHSARLTQLMTRD